MAIRHVTSLNREALHRQKGDRRPIALHGQDGKTEGGREKR